VDGGAVINSDGIATYAWLTGEALEPPTFRLRLEDKEYCGAALETFRQPLYLLPGTSVDPCRFFCDNGFYPHQPGFERSALLVR